MVRAEKKTPKKLKKGSKVSSPKRLTVIQCVVNTGSRTGWKNTAILWTEQPTGALVGAGLRWPGKWQRRWLKGRYRPWWTLFYSINKEKVSKTPKPRTILTSMVIYGTEEAEWRICVHPHHRLQFHRIWQNCLQFHKIWRNRLQFCRICQTNVHCKN